MKILSVLFLAFTLAGVQNADAKLKLKGSVKKFLKRAKKCRKLTKKNGKIHKKMVSSGVDEAGLIAVIEPILKDGKKYKDVKDAGKDLCESTFSGDDSKIKKCNKHGKKLAKASQKWVKKKCDELVKEGSSESEAAIDESAVVSDSDIEEAATE
ncbi:MAG: hypothetical protein HOE90_14220 [Bacteriovoracaceae bacterium]|nr:hypothetical protein [Bacteriovoracaceae bacterium]